MTDGFEPGKYLTKVGGNDYLEVRWRLVWLRFVHPDAHLITECTQLTDQKAVFRADVAIPGGGSATGWGSETPGDFRDYLEKAETKAIGRALAALGFGTQFCSDHDFGAASGRVVDAPVLRHRTPSASVLLGPSGVSGISDRQDGFIRTLMKDHGVTDEMMHVMIKADYKRDHLRDLTKQEASDYIGKLQALPVAEDMGITQEPQVGYEINQQGYGLSPEPAYAGTESDRWTN